MGNSSSTPAKDQSLKPGGSDERSVSPGPGDVHSSLRNKKRSLELPDLASISQGPYAAAAIAQRGRVGGPAPAPFTPPPKSAAIAIPVSPPGPFNHYHDANNLEPIQRTTLILPSRTDVRIENERRYQMMEEEEDPPELTRERVQRHQERMERKERQREERSRKDQEARREKERREQEDRYLAQHQQQRLQQQQAHPRGRQQPAAVVAQPPPSTRQQRQVAKIQQIYERSNEPPAPPSTAANPGFDSHYRKYKEVVRSSIPIVLKAKVKPPPKEVKPPVVEEFVFEPTPVKVVWKGGGDEVVLARAGDDEWKGRQPMMKDPEDPTCWVLTIDLLPGTHHVRFLVDGIWRVADDLPAAVDDQGSLANYVAVPFPFGAPGAPGSVPVTAEAPEPAPVEPPPPPVPRLLPKPFPKMTMGGLGGPKYTGPGHSFWSSADSSADGEDEDITQPRQPKIDLKKHPNISPGAIEYMTATWTDVPPPELIEAQKEEEAYLQASAGHYDGASTRVTGFVPAPNIPPAPSLPRYLDKLILNSKVGEQKPVVPPNNGGVTDVENPRRGGKHGDLGGVGSGQGGSKRERRERAEREERRERERDRDRIERDRQDRERERAATRARRGTLPPAPPPSVIGEDDEPRELSPYESHVAKQGQYMPANLLKQHGYGAGGNAVPGGSGLGGVMTPKQSSAPVTPTGHLSPNLTPPTLAPQWGYINPRNPVTSPPPPPPQLPARAPISGSRAITIDDANLPPLTDDNSVLPVPSHVVLHHLCTSAIRNGVLAVAHTTRYRKKYLTTIYCKPT